MESEDEKGKGRQVLENVKSKSDDDYEKNITYISAGTLVLSLTFIEKIVNVGVASHIWVLIVSWSMLALTLLVNLISHQFSSLYHERTIDEWDRDDPSIDSNVKSRNRVIRNMNLFTSLGLFVGIGFLILFCSLNAYKMANNNDEKKTLEDGKIYIEKGRTIQLPRTPSTSTTAVPAPTQTNPSTIPSTDTSKK
jgi:hypothetical protein